MFEPFFTTKPTRRGHRPRAVDGLRLRQAVRRPRPIYSEPGHGTTVKIYLPRLVGAEEVSRGPGRHAEPRARRMPRARAGETILVVEDDEERARLREARLCGARLPGAGGRRRRARRFGLVDRRPASICCSPMSGCRAA